MPSKDALYHPSDLMRLKDAGIVLIEHSGQEDKTLITEANPFGITYEVRLSKKTVLTVTEDLLTPITKSDFYWYKHPATGKMNIGKHQFLPWIAILYSIWLFGAACCIITIKDFPLVWIAVFILVAIVIMHGLGIDRNYRKKQM